MDLVKGAIQDAEQAAEKTVKDSLDELKATVKQILDMVAEGYTVTITLGKKGA